jgi:hypothetical protein
MTGVYRKEGELRNERQQTTGLIGDKVLQQVMNRENYAVRISPTWKPG